MQRNVKMKPRVRWDFNPVTRVVPSAKRYRRSKAKAAFRKALRDG